MIPCIATVGMKWGILLGDRQQKVAVPLVTLLLLAFAYWLSRSVSLQVFGYRLSGLVVVMIGAFVGLVGVPLSWGQRT